MGDWGIKVVKAGTDVATATGSDVLLNTQYPHMKLDTTISTSFQDIRFTFNNDPPEPVGPATTLDTQVYSFAHPYTYKPSVWMLAQVVAPVASNFYQNYFQADGIVSAQTAFDGAGFFVTADASNVYFNVHKFQDAASGGKPNPLTGLILDVRVYVFVDDTSL